MEMNSEESYSNTWPIARVLVVLLSLFNISLSIAYGLIFIKQYIYSLLHMFSSLSFEYVLSIILMGILGGYIPTLLILASLFLQWKRITLFWIDFILLVMSIVSTVAFLIIIITDGGNP